MTSVVPVNQEDEVPKNKILVRSNLMYHFQDIESLAANPASNTSFHSNNNRSFVDGIREGTLRTWYAYGWGTPDEGLAEAIEGLQGRTFTTSPIVGTFSLIGATQEDPSPPSVAGLGTGGSPRSLVPIFGYFPFAHTNTRDLESNWWAWSGEFQRALGVTPPTAQERFLGPGAYFDMMSSAPKPSYYISMFRDERPIIDVYEGLIGAKGDASTLADTMAVLDASGAPGDWSEEGMIYAYHWLTEAGIRIQEGERAGELMGPTLDQVIDACGGNVQKIIDEYNKQGWIIPPQITQRYNTYTSYQEDMEAFVSGGWTRELIHQAWELGLASPQEVKTLYENQRWGDLPPDIQADYDRSGGAEGEYQLSDEKLHWFSAWHYYDKCDQIELLPMWSEPPTVVKRGFGGAPEYHHRGFGHGLGRTFPQRFGPPRHGDVHPLAPGRYRSTWREGEYTHTRRTTLQEIEGIARGGEAAWLEQMVMEGRLLPIDFETWFGTPRGEGWRWGWGYPGVCGNRRGMPGNNAWGSRNLVETDTRANVGSDWILGYGGHRRHTTGFLNWELTNIYELAIRLHGSDRIDPFAGAPGGDLAMSLVERIILGETEAAGLGTFDTTLEEFRNWSRGQEAQTEHRHDCVRRLLTRGDNPPDIKLLNWKRSLVTTKPMPGEDFSTLITSQIKPALNKKEIFVPGILDVRLEVSGPKRYYDYVFQLPTVDTQVQASSVYNGYFAAEFEERVTKLPLVLEPIIPNIYIVDFANTSVPEYYELLSLNAGTTAYPDGYIAGFTRNYALETAAYESLFEPFGYTTEYRYIDLWVAGVQRGLDDTGPRTPLGRIKRLSDKYRDLIFSSIYRQNYLNTTNEVKSNPDWVPMYNQFDFSLDMRSLTSAFGEPITEFVSTFSDPAVRGERPPYDPMAHLISDVSLSNPVHRLFAEVHTAQPLPAEATRADENSRANANTRSETLELKEDFKYKNNHVWDIHEWFELYNIPSRGDRCLDAFYDPRIFPGQAMMLTGPALGDTNPPGFSGPSSLRIKPAPVGAKPRTIDLGQYLGSCALADGTPTEFPGQDTNDIGTEVSVPDYTDPPAILLTPDGTEWRNPDSETVSVFKNALSTLYSSLNEKVGPNLRSYREVADGQLAYSEPLFYRLEKIDPATGQVIQNFFFPSDLMRNGFTYIDAQVHYGVGYNYALHGYYFVVGNEYWYEDLTSPRALEHRQRLFVSGNTYVAARALQSGVTEDEWLVTNWDLANQPGVPDPEAFRRQTAALLGPEGEGGISLSAYQDLVVEARAHVGPAYDNMREVYGDEYYKEPFWNGGNPHAQFAVNNRPHLVLVETTVFSPSAPPLSAKVVDSPPLPPDVDIVPYRSVNNKVLLMLNGSVGSYNDNPIVINQNDIGKYRDQISNQNPLISPDVIEASNIETDFEINFSTDDFPEFFEVYRLDFAPRSYRDFSTAARRVLNNTVRNKVVMTANSFIDTVVPNKKYWYTFRTIDVHGNVSNPSEILQFEMVDAGNSIYPLIEGYTFPKQEITYTKPLRKYLMIAPSAIQEGKHRNATNAQKFVDHPKLGTDAEKNIWGERYKLRLTSKLTGKKIDINFVFKQGEAPDTSKL